MISKNGNSAKRAGTAGATAGGLGFSFATCHSVCQALLSVFAIAGITLLGMPLAFLEPYSVPLLILAAISIGISVWMCKRHHLPLRTLLKPFGIGLLAALVIVLSVFSFTVLATGEIGASADANAAAGGAGTSQFPDKCAVPEGYTEEEWIQHMGHHPDLYAECLGG
ncbi:MAG: hypothetical protein HYW25_01705 [Candidatus Aenigmarchaeota archaeon]|nr:hypothetical protein [Candidatus Aenigmarchaeota archaeon]